MIGLVEQTIDTGICILVSMNKLNIQIMESNLACTHVYTFRGNNN